MSNLKFQPRIDSLEDRCTPASLSISQTHAAANLVGHAAPVTSPPNTTFATAKDLGTLTGTALNPTVTRALTGLSLETTAAWFKFTTTLKGVAGSYASIQFLNAQGNLNLRLFDSVGVQLAMSRGTGNQEAVSLVGRPPGTYYVQVSGLAGAHNPNYTLSVKQAISTTTLLATPVVPPVVPPPPPPGPPTVPNTIPTIPPPPADGFNITLQQSGLTTLQQNAFQQAANRWGQIIVGDIPSAFFGIFPVDDILVNVSVAAIDGIGNIAAQTRVDLVRPVLSVTPFLPIHATIIVDSADLPALTASPFELYEVALHELAHALGFGPIWQQKGLITNTRTADPRFNGAQATVQYNLIFGTNVTSVPLEVVSSVDTLASESHWRESVFKTELMTPILNSGVVNPLSRVTVAAMADLGYTVNLNAADPFIPS